MQPGGRRFDPGPVHLIYQCPAVTSLRGFFLAAVKDLTARFDISQPAVSQHLATLRRARLVSERRDGRLVYYRVEPKGLRPLIDWIAHYQTFWLERFDRLQVLLKETGE